MYVYLTIYPLRITLDFLGNLPYSLFCMQTDYFCIVLDLSFTEFNRSYSQVNLYRFSALSLCTVL